MTATPLAPALEPVRQRLRHNAEHEAAEIRAAAQATATDILLQAHREAAAITDRAATTAAATAAPFTAAELRKARDTARSAVLAAQREAFEELHRRVQVAVAALPSEPGYDRLGQRIARLVQEAAGEDAQLTLVPAGGLVARAHGMIVDCSLSRLADVAMTQLDAAIRELWTP